MKRLLIVILSVCFVICTTIGWFNYSNIQSANNTGVLSKSTIVVDAGHGGMDAGTIGIDGSAEKGINLSIALILYDYLMVSGINSVLIRNGDYEVYKNDEDRSKSDLYNRMDLVNSIPNSILISIHQNHFDDEKEWGTQIWYSANTEFSKTLADDILCEVKKNLQPNNERLNKASDNSYYLLYKAKSPSIMIECGFMSNREENAKLQSIDYQKDIVYSILTGICEKV